MRIASGDWQAELRPGIGGAIAELRHAGLDVLRPMPAEAASPLAAACFPLVPYANRIRDGRFTIAGKPYALPANFPPEPHSLHGTGWQAAWETVEAGDAHAVIVHRHAGGGGWPWPFVAEQRVELGAGGCDVVLTLRSLAEEPMPAGLGLHPYFRRRLETRLRFGAASVLLTDTSGAPNGVRASADRFGDWAAGAPLPTGLVDHCHAGWAGEAVITDDLGTIRLTARGAPHLHLYAPPGSDILCCEPVSHLPDALNGSGPMPMLAPGEQTQIAMQIAVV